MSKRDNIVKWSIVSIFVALYAMVSIISTIHVIDFFRLSNPEWLAITLAIAFEVGAAACLGAIVILDRTSRWLVWMLFILITGMQMMGNMYYAYSHLQDFQNWTELFALNEEEPIFQKRILSIVSGAILPIVALGFIKSLVDYIRPSTVNDQITDSVTSEKPKTRLQEDIDRVWADVARRKANGEIYEPTEEDLADEPTALANSGYRERAEMEAYQKEIEEESEDEESLKEDLEATIQDGLEYIEQEEIQENREKVKEVEKKIAKAIATNPDLKDKLSKEIKKIEEEDKYNKSESSSIANVNAERRTFGGM
jgi:hypothetical protein